MSLLQDHPPVTEAYGKYRQFNQDERLRAIDEAHQRYLHDLATDIEAAKSERDIAIARNLKSEGFDAGVISKVTGLSLTEVERLN